MHAAADSGCNETAQVMCERFNHGFCRLQEMDLLLGTNAPHATRRRSIHSGLTVARMAPCSTTPFPGFSRQPFAHKIRSKIRINDSYGSEVAARHHVPSVSLAHWHSHGRTVASLNSAACCAADKFTSAWTNPP